MYSQLPSATRGHLNPVFLCVDSEGAGETEWMCYPYYMDRWDCANNVNPDQIAFDQNLHFLLFPSIIIFC